MNEPVYREGGETAVREPESHPDTIRTGPMPLSSEVTASSPQPDEEVWNRHVHPFID